MLKGLSVSLMALAAGMAVAAPAAAADAGQAGYTSVLNAGGDLYVQPWDGAKYPVKSAREGGLETAAMFKLPAIQPDTNWLVNTKAYQGQIIDQALGKCLGSASNVISGPAKLVPVDCNANNLGQTWTFGFTDATKTSFALMDFSRQYSLGASQIAFTKDETGQQYPISGTLYRVPTLNSWVWPNSTQYTGQWIQSAAGLISNQQ